MELKKIILQFFYVYYNYFIGIRRLINGSVSSRTSHHLDQVENNRRLMYFRHVTETDIIESSMHLNNEGSINHVSHKCMVMQKLRLLLLVEI